MSDCAFVLLLWFGVSIPVSLFMAAVIRPPRGGYRAVVRPGCDGRPGVPPSGPSGVSRARLMQPPPPPPGPGGGSRAPR